MADDAFAGLRTACGEEHVRQATRADAAAGHQPRFVARPGSTVETGAVMRAAAEHGLRVLARGAGTKLDWAAPAEAVDLVLDCTRMDRVLEYNPADLVLRVQAGVTLASVRETTAAQRQLLALDPIVGGGTIGGTIATNASGPLRMSRGSCRDLLIGITVVLADGTVTHSGGKVVKNVAGYDLGKLYTGSFGTLGVITEAVFRLHPLPAARLVAWRAFADIDEACAAAARVRRGRLAVSAVEIDRPEPTGGITVAVLIEGGTGWPQPPGPDQPESDPQPHASGAEPPRRNAGVTQRAALAAELLGPGAAVDDRIPTWWGAPPWPADGTALKLAVRLSGLPSALGALAHHGAGLGLAVRGSLGAGVLYAGLPAGTPMAALAELTTALRAELHDGADGSLVVLRTPEPDGLDLWGPVAGLTLMRRVKERFDPDRRLAPGRFVGGI